MLDRTLPSTWQLRGSDIPALRDVASRAHTVVVDDVEHLCAAIVVDVSRSDAPYAATELFDLYEALGFLLGRVIEVLPRYDPTRGRRIHDPWTAGFKAWLHDELLCDLHDHWRSWNGRKGQKRLPILLAEKTTKDGGSFDKTDAPDTDDQDARSWRERQSRGALAEGAGDRGDDRGDVLRGLLESGNREVLQQVEALGLSPDPGARGRVEDPDRAGETVSVAA